MDQDTDPKYLTREQLSLHSLFSDDKTLAYKYPARESGIRFVSPAERPKDVNAYYLFKADQLEGSSSESTASFKVPKPRKYIGRCILEQDWPALRVKDSHPDIEMCWDENRGVLPFKQITARIGDATGCPHFDRHAAIAVKGFYTEKNIVLEQEIVGNNPLEITWTRELPASTTSPAIPWSWARGAPFNYFPNMFLRRDSGFQFVVERRHEIWKFLRFRRRLPNGQYEYLEKTSYEHLQMYLVEVPTSGHLKNPRVSAEFMDILQAEHARIASCIDRTVWPFEDFLTMKDDSLRKYGETATFKVVTSRIIKAIFIMIENNDAKRRRYYGNYTSDSTSSSIGYDVVDLVSFYRDTQLVSFGLPFIKSMMREHFPSVPVSRGVLAIPLCMNPRLLEENVGVAIGAQPNNEIKIKLKDCSPFHDQDPNTKFRAYIVLQIIRDVTFTRDKTTGDEITFTPKID